LHRDTEAASSYRVDCGDLFALQEDSNRTRITKYQSNEIPNIRTKL
jgi:hypothetical protein